MQRHVGFFHVSVDDGAFLETLDVQNLSGLYGAGKRVAFRGIKPEILFQKIGY